MSFIELVHDPTYIFDGTNYDVWKIRMLNLFRAICPNYIKRIVDVDFPPPKDSQELSLEDEENSHLDTLVSNGLICVLSDVVLASIMPFRSAHELWTKLQDIFLETLYYRGAPHSLLLPPQTKTKVTDSYKSTKN